MVTKYGVLLGYGLFFITSQFLLFGLGSLVVNSPFTTLVAPTCTFGLFIIDGLVLCAFSFISLFFSLFAVSSTIFVIEAFFVIPFLILLVLIVADVLRGSG